MNIIKAVLAELGAAFARTRALSDRAAASQAAGQRIMAALYDGYVGAYAEFYRNEYERDIARR